MPYTFELALDPASAAVVRQAWQELDDAGIGYVARLGVRPHVSRGIWESLDHGRAEAELRRFAGATSEIGLTFASMGLFPGVAVFLAPTVTVALLELHAADFHRRFAQLGQGAWGHYQPGIWVPHCTLATNLALDRFGDALAIAGRAPLPLESRLVEAGIVEFRPVKQLVSCPLGGR